MTQPTKPLVKFWMKEDVRKALDLALADAREQARARRQRLMKMSWVIEALVHPQLVRYGFLPQASTLPAEHPTFTPKEPVDAPNGGVRLSPEEVAAVRSLADAAEGVREVLARRGV